MPISLRKKQPRRQPDPVPSLHPLTLDPSPLLDADWNDNTSPNYPSYNAKFVPVGVTGHMSLTSPLAPISSANSGTQASHASCVSTRSRAPSLIRAPNGTSPAFHRPFSQSYIVSAVPAMPDGLSRAGTMRRARQRRQEALTVIVAGPQCSGKTSFIDALTGVLDSEAPRLTVRMGPTTGVIRHDVHVPDERRGVTLLDTPGLPSGEKKQARARALNALLTIVEERLARVLDEEAKVVRRKSDGGELVHLIIYVIDARTVLAPVNPVDVDWDMVHEPLKSGTVARPESELVADPAELEARLSVDDIEAMRRFSTRANVLPVLTHSDALTTAELDAVRAAVRRDLTTVFGREPLGAWGVLTAGQDVEENEPDEETEENPAVESPFPYAVFAPEPGPGFTREFRWGIADAADGAHSDLPAVREAVVNASEWLRTTTREVVYERFRTERLLTARGSKSLRV